MNQDEKIVRVGVGVMVMRDDKVLLGKRKGSHGSGTYSFPGGHLEYMETYSDCAKRESMEEAGISIKNIRLLYVTTIKEYAPKFYAHIGLVADWDSGNPKIMEPDKCEGWDWYDIDTLPSPLFATITLSVDAFKTGKNFY